MDTECVRWTGGWIAFQKRNKRCWCTVRKRNVWKGGCAFDMHRDALSLCCHYHGHCKWRTPLGLAALLFVGLSSSGHLHPPGKEISHYGNHFARVESICISKILAITCTMYLGYKLLNLIAGLRNVVLVTYYCYMSTNICAVFSLSR